MSETLAEALDRLAREGFARRFERVGDALVCGSCGERFSPDALVVDDVIEVDAPGARTTLYALRCSDCGAKGSWILTDDAGPEDRALLDRLGRCGPPGREHPPPGPAGSRSGT